MQSYDAMMQPFFVTDTFFDKTYHFLQKGWKYPKEPKIRNNFFEAQFLAN
jgi:hypothetical protein